MRLIILLLLSMLNAGNAFVQSKNEVIQKTLSYYEANPYLRVSFKVWEKPFTEGDTLYYEGEFLEFAHQPIEMIRHYYQFMWSPETPLLDTLFHFRRSDSIFIERNDSLFTFEYTEYPYNWLVLGFLRFKHGEFSKALEKSFSEIPLRKIRMSKTIFENKPCYNLRVEKKRERRYLGHSTAKNLYSQLWLDSASGEILAWESGFVLNDNTNYERLELKALTANREQALLDSVRRLHELMPRTIQKSQSSEPIPKKELTLTTGDTLLVNRFMDQNGDSLLIIENGKQYYVLDFWYTGCAPCIQAIPDNQDLFEELKSENIGYYGITVNYRNRNFPPVFLKRFRGSYPLLYSDSQFLKSTIGLTAYPTYVVLNKNGIVVDVIEGYSRNIKKKIKKAIQQDREKRNESSDEK